MARPTCYVIAGPESAGNRLAAALLISAGCYGQASTAQEWDDSLPEGETPAVVIRSFPHGGTWPALHEICAELKRRGYRVVVVVTVREPAALASSQVLRGHCDAEAADARIRKAYLRITRDLYAADDFVLLPFEALALHPAAAGAAVLARLGLPAIYHEELVVDGEARPITDENGKHYAAGVG